MDVRNMDVRNMDISNFDVGHLGVGHFGVNNFNVSDMGIGDFGVPNFGIRNFNPHHINAGEMSRNLGVGELGVGELSVVGVIAGGKGNDDNNNNNNNNHALSMGGDKWKLFTTREMASLSAISILTMAEKLRPMFQKNNQKTICEILSGVYEANVTPVQVPIAKQRGRPKKVVVDMPKNTHAVLNRNKCLWVGLLFTTFPSAIPPTCSASQLASALLQLTKEPTTKETTTKEPTTKETTTKETTNKRAPEKCIQFIESTLSIWTDIQIPAYYDYIN